MRVLMEDGKGTADNTPPFSSCVEAVSAQSRAYSGTNGRTDGRKRRLLRHDGSRKTLAEH